jgi:hypothetical protein
MTDAVVISAVGGSGEYTTSNDLYQRSSLAAK